MSGEDIPYQLRPNKFIDRELFMDLLGRLVPERGASKYVYVSMGGKHLVDHGAVYRRVGITNLFSFDLDQHVVARQKFNRPIDHAICDKMHSGSLAGKLDTIISSFASATNLIVWLDYTKPRDRLSQMQELVEVATRLQPGDVIRITLNANPKTLEEDQDYSKWKEMGFLSPNEYRASRLKNQLGNFVPTTLESIGETDFPAALCECVALAFSKAEGESPGLRFEPLLLTTYRDGQRMATVTCIAVDDSHDRSRSLLKDWDFTPSSWTDLTHIDAPDLSMREKLRIDEHLSKKASIVLEELGFLPAKNQEKSIEAIQSYQTLHRYYPAFHNIES